METELKKSNTAMTKYNFFVSACYQTRCACEHKDSNSERSWYATYFTLVKDGNDGIIIVNKWTSITYNTHCIIF